MNTLLLAPKQASIQGFQVFPSKCKMIGFDSNFVLTDWSFNRHFLRKEGGGSGRASPGALGGGGSVLAKLCVEGDKNAVLLAACRNQHVILRPRVSFFSSTVQKGAVHSAPTPFPLHIPDRSFRIGPFCSDIYGAQLAMNVK